MPRPLSWLPRLHDIRRSVANSVRSHYSRTDLEEVFGLQPSSAGKLLELFPTTLVGTSRLVEQAALLAFLEAVQEAEDPAAAIEAQRSAAKAPSRRKLRTLVRTDLPTATLNSLPGNLTLSTGRLEVTFLTVEQLAQTLYSFAQILWFEEELFEERFVPKPPAQPTPEADEVRRMFQELEEMKAAATRR